MPNEGANPQLGQRCSNCGLPLVKVGFLEEKDNSEVIVCVGCDKPNLWPLVSGDIK